jgi:hypothetical protein
MHSSTIRICSPTRLWLLLVICAFPAMALAQAKPTYVCTPNTGTLNDRQAFIAFDNGAVQWCRGGIACTKLTGMPNTAGLAAVALACEREQRAWVALSDGSVYRCGTAQCTKQPLKN